MYKKAFWVLIFVTVITMILQIGGYEVLETVIFLIIMDFIALWLYLEKKKSLTELDNSTIKKIGSLETVCSSILEGINAVSSISSLEERINNQREGINSMLEKINEKTLVLEEKINKFELNLSNHITNFDNKTSENKKEKSTLDTGREQI